MRPKNKQEFNKFKGTKIIYKDKQHTELDIENNIEDYPELNFDIYPEWNDKDEK